MSSHPAVTNPEALLEHLDWVRELALRLTRGDSDLADDLRQETWLAAQRSARPSYVPLRAWLAGLVRNLAFKTTRGAVRRRRRESLAARPEALMSTVEIVDRAATQEQVVRSVLELDEPYRSTVMLRYFDQLTPKDIARQQSIPVATVKTRLRRGLDQLRARLAKRFGGEGEAHSRLLAIVFAPIGLRAPRPVVPWVPISVAAIGAGIVAMVAFITPEDTDAIRDVELASGSAHETGLLPAVEEPSRVALEAGVDEDAPADLESGASTEADIWADRVHGVVLDLHTRPVPGVGLAFHVDGEVDPRAPVVITDTDGLFTLEVPSERGRVAVQSQEWTAVLTPLVFPGQGDTELVAVVAPRATVIGRVFGPDDQAIAGAQVGFIFAEDPASGLDRLARRSRIGSWLAYTDHAGAFELVAPESGTGRIRVRAMGYRTRDVPLDTAGTERVEVALTALVDSEVVRGRVVDALGAPVAGAWVGAGGATTRSDEVGRFQLKFARRPRAVTLTAVAEGQVPASARWTPSEASLPVELRLPGPAPIARGRVVDGAGAPVAGVRVRLLGGTPFGRIPRHVAGLTSMEPVTVEALVTPDPFHPWVETGADGVFALAATRPRHTLAFHHTITLARCREQVETGQPSIDIVLAEWDVAAPVRCRALGPDGEPVAGAYVMPFRKPRPDEPPTLREYGPRLLTGLDGRAEWPALVGDELRFHITGPPGWFLHDYRLPPDVVEEITLPVSREAALRLVFPATDHPDAFRLLDAAGQVLQLVHGSGEVNLMEIQGVIRDDGRSPTYGVPAEATTLVLLIDGEEFSRVSIELTPGEIAILDF